MTVAERLENKKESNRRCMKKRTLEGKNTKGSQQTKDYQEMRANDYPGYSVYYIPEEHYIGMSKNVYSRMIKHNHLGKIIDGWEVIESFENPIRAHLMETQFHLMGYNGYRP